VIISEEVQWLSLDDWTSERIPWNARSSVARRLGKPRYRPLLAHYSADFSRRTRTGRLEPAQAHGQQRQTWIKVKVSNLSMFEPGKAGLVSVPSIRIRSSNLFEHRQKAPYWLRRKRLRIIYEGTA